MFLKANILRMVRSKRELAIFLSKLEVFEQANVQLEQYPSDGQVAATLLWQAAINEDIEEKHVLDLGCGTGILGIGALLLGARKVTFVDIDPNVLKIVKKNFEIMHEEWEIDIEGKWEFINTSIDQLAIKEEDDMIVIMNPPFGTKLKHADKKFLQTAIRYSPTIYSMHKTSTKVFLEAFSKDNNYDLFWFEPMSFPIKQTMKEHTKRIERIEVAIIGMERN